MLYTAPIGEAIDPIPCTPPILAIGAANRSLTGVGDIILASPANPRQTPNNQISVSPETWTVPTTVAGSGISVPLRLLKHPSPQPLVAAWRLSASGRLSHTRPPYSRTVPPVHRPFLTRLPSSTISFFAQLPLTSPLNNPRLFRRIPNPRMTNPRIPNATLTPPWMWPFPTPRVTMENVQVHHLRLTLMASLDSALLD